MTDDIELTPDEKIRAAAKAIAHLPAEKIPGTEDLPDEVRDGDLMSVEDSTEVFDIEDEPDIDQ